MGGPSPFEPLLGQQQALEESQAGCHDADDWRHQTIKQALVWPLRLLFLPRGGCSIRMKVQLPLLGQRVAGAALLALWGRIGGCCQRRAGRCADLWLPKQVVLAQGGLALALGGVVLVAGVDWPGDSSMWCGAAHPTLLQRALAQAVAWGLPRRAASLVIDRHCGLQLASR